MRIRTLRRRVPKRARVAVAALALFDFGFILSIAIPDDAVSAFLLFSLAALATSAYIGTTLGKGSARAGGA